MVNKLAVCCKPANEGASHYQMEGYAANMRCMESAFGISRATTILVSEPDAGRRSNKNTGKSLLMVCTQIATISGLVLISTYLQPVKAL